MIQVLAASDWRAVAAVIVFTLISLVANWVKKRSEAATGSEPTRDSEADADFEPVELFDERKPNRTSPPRVARPKAPPIVAVPRGRLQPPTAKPKLGRAPTAEWATRVGGTKLPTPVVPHSETVSQRARAKPAHASRPAETRPAAETTLSVNEDAGIPNLYDPKALRRAIIAAELLNPPIALRDPAMTFGYTC